VLLLDLIDDAEAIARYEAWHLAGAVPAAVVAGIRRSGVEAMEIWRTGDRLVMVVEAGTGFDPAARTGAEDPDLAAWERLMDGFQRPLPWAAPGAKWTAATRIFDLGDQGGEQG